MLKINHVTLCVAADRANLMNDGFELKDYFCVFEEGYRLYNTTLRRGAGSL